MSQYNEKIDEVLETGPVLMLEQKDWVALAIASLDQAGVQVHDFADACAKVARRGSKTGKWPEYLKAVLEELEIEDD